MSSRPSSPPRGANPFLHVVGAHVGDALYFGYPAGLLALKLVQSSNGCFVGDIRPPTADDPVWRAPQELRPYRAGELEGWTCYGRVVVDEPGAMRIVCDTPNVRPTRKIPIAHLADLLERCQRQDAVSP